MTAVIYARYSSDSQREASIEGQLRDCKDYAEKNGITVVGTYIDRAYSAKTDDRCQRSRGQIPSPAFFLPAHNFRAGISDGQYHRQNPEKPVIDIDHSKFSQDIFHRKWIVYRKGQKNSGCYEHIPLFLFSF